jgi:AIPR protein
MINVDYPNILNLVKDYDTSGRAESAAFLMWYLENYYRLDPQESVDSVCDQNGDKGVDGIFVNDANNTIDIFQTKISQTTNRTVGDTALKEFYGTLSQFFTKAGIQNLMDTGGSAQVVSLIKRLNLIAVLDQYTVQGVFISNVNMDANGRAYLAQTPQLSFVGKSILESTYISDARDVPLGQVAEFDIAGLNISRHYVDVDTHALIAPIKANELVRIPGIVDQSVFAYNVRGPLGGTNVNRDIIKSIKDKSLHRKFPLFHNGITIVTNKIEESAEKLKVETFFVVNGCQSLTSLFTHRTELTDDLRILTKFVQVSVDSDLAEIITKYSNNQNGVKARDFKANNSIQVRLQNEFDANYGTEYFYEIKRGEKRPIVRTISNEDAGIYLMSFDLKEPWSTHRKYQVFDEKYTDLFGRPDVNAHRIVMLAIMDEVIKSKLSQINNTLVAKYALTRFALMFMVRQILENDNSGRLLIANPKDFVLKLIDRMDFRAAISQIVDDVIVDFNGEVDNLGQDFDYRSRLREETWVKKMAQDIVGNYLKLIKRNRIDSFDQDWNNRLAARTS